jgi:hypothetical protein
MGLSRVAESACFHQRRQRADISRTGRYCRQLDVDLVTRITGICGVRRM